MENLAHSNFAFFTGFIMSSLTVLPCALLGLCHSWFSFNGVNQEVTVKLMLLLQLEDHSPGSKISSYLEEKEKKTTTRRVCPLFTLGPPPFFHSKFSGSIKCNKINQRSEEMIAPLSLAVRQPLISPASYML